MSKTLVLALAAATLLGASAASAQSIDLGGPGGPSIDLRSGQQRARDREIAREREELRAERYERRRDRGCRTVTVREEDDDGRTVVRRRREC